MYAYMLQYIYIYCIYISYIYIYSIYVQYFIVLCCIVPHFITSSYYTYVAIVTVLKLYNCAINKNKTKTNCK